MNTPNLFGSDIEQTNQQRRLNESTWEGASLLTKTGTLDEIYQSLPVFSRHPFRSGGEENRYKEGKSGVNHSRLMKVRFR